MKKWVLSFTAVLASTIPALADWNSVGSVEFSSTNESRSLTIPTATRGNIALRPVDNGARCTRVTGTLANGETKDLALTPPETTSSGVGEYLPKGEVTKVTLPDAQNITQMDLTCHAESGARVRVDVLAGDA